jgi:hypothetical protein
MKGNGSMKNKKTLVLVLVIAALCAVVVYMLIKPGAPNDDTGNGVSGTISEGWDPGIDQGGVEATGIQIPGYKDAKMKEGDTTLHLSIGNPKDNKAGFYATVQLEDGTVLYASSLLEPGYGIKDLPLKQTLQKGTYDAFVTFQIVSLDEAHAPMNTARSAFKLYVE